MNIVKANFQQVKEPNKTKKIEQIARLCYKSEDKICEGSDIKMVNNLIKRKHLAMLEHADAAFQITPYLRNLFTQMIDEMSGKRLPIGTQTAPMECHLNMTFEDIPGGTRTIISGNFRAWYEFVEYWYTYDPHYIIELQHEFQYINLACAGILSEFLNMTNYKEPLCPNIQEIKDITTFTPRERMVHERLTVIFTTDRGVTHELVRMRKASFGQESTRYCNYAAGKFGSEISVLSPYFWESEPELYNIWQEACEAANKYYNKLIELGAKPEMARTILPHSTKADIGVTANLTEWRHIFELRACDSTGPAHPQIKEIMVPLLESLQADGAHDFAFGDLKPVYFMDTTKNKTPLQACTRGGRGVNCP